jgi:HEXXH motif-containing protein
VLRLRECLLWHAERHSDWLYHPCAKAFGNGSARDTLSDDLSLIVWAGLNDRDIDTRLTVPRTLSVWTPDGGKTVRAGEYALGEILSDIRVGGGLLSLDVLSPMAAAAHPAAWARVERLDEEAAARLRGEIYTFLRAMDFLSVSLVECAVWVRQATKVVVPLVSAGDGQVRSTSISGYPATVFTDITSQVELLETLVHESAHQHFFLAEANEPLVDPRHDGLYYSPLRKEPRPLRGVFLAFHALAFIRRLYCDLAGTGLMEEPQRAAEVERAGESLLKAHESLKSGERYLTGAGRTLMTALSKV